MTVRALALLLVLALALAPPALADEAAWRALGEPGTVGVLRHALAPGTGDPPGFRVNDCATQRNLSDEGRAQARALGAAIRQRGIEVDRVLTSQWCRARETAELLDLAPVEPFPPLNSFFSTRERAEVQTEAVRTHLAAHARDEKLILVTHQVNITALTGVYPGFLTQSRCIGALNRRKYF